MALEDEGRFEQAEDEFIKGKKCKEAIDMYIYQCEWGAAMRVAEQHEPAAIGDVQEAHGRHKATNKDYNEAEQLFISAKKYEVAIKMYKDVQRWDDAIRLAKKFATRMVVTLQQEKMSGNPGSVDGLEMLLDKAKMAQSEGQFDKAIQFYLEVDQTHTKDEIKLEEAWENAVTIAMDKDINVQRVVEDVSKRFISIRRYEEAAELLRGVDNHKGVVEAYIAGKMYEKAKRYAETSAPRLVDFVNQSMNNQYALSLLSAF
jgi:intraflagellar transport protein 172